MACLRKGAGVEEPPKHILSNARHVVFIVVRRQAAGPSDRADGENGARTIQLEAGGAAADQTEVAD